MNPINLSRYLLLFVFVFLNACGGGGGSGTPAAANTSTEPALVCATPLDGATVNQAPGLIQVTGSVQNSNGVSNLQVNGNPVVFDATGSFSTQINSSWGMNFVNLSAMDATGQPLNHTCAFLLSEVWAPDNTALPSTISVKARPPALDDGDRTDINSFADIVQTVLNSTDFKNQLVAAIVTGKPNTQISGCQDFVLFCTSYNAYIRVTDVQINGPNTTTLTLSTNNEVLSTSTLRNIHLALRVTGDLSGVAFDVTGSADVSSVTLNTALQNVTPANPTVIPTSIQLAPVNITLAGLSATVDGLPGSFLQNLVDTAVNGLLNSGVKYAIQQQIANSLTSFIQDPFANLIVSNLAGNFDVPRLDNGTPIPIDFTAVASTINITSDGVLVSLGTQFHTTPAPDRPTLGAPIPSGERILDGVTGQSIGAAIHSGLLNQAVYALWRGGYFDVTLGGGALGGIIPTADSMVLAADLPPAVQIRNDGRLEVAVGALHVNLTHPARFTAPVDITIGGRVSCATRLNGEDLILENCIVDEFHLSIVDTTLDATSQTEVSQLMSELLMQVAATAGNSALPVLPIPDFPLPSGYGFTAGSSLGIVTPLLSTNGNHFVLDGGFSIR